MSELITPTSASCTAAEVWAQLWQATTAVVLQGVAAWDARERERETLTALLTAGLELDLSDLVKAARGGVLTADIDRLLDVTMARARALRLVIGVAPIVEDSAVWDGVDLLFGPAFEALNAARRRLDGHPPEPPRARKSAALRKSLRLLTQARRELEQRQCFDSMLFLFRYVAGDEYGAGSKLEELDEEIAALRVLVARVAERAAQEAAR